MLQDTPVSNAGKGSNLTMSGGVECDASIMAGDGTQAAVGAVPGRHAQPVAAMDGVLVLNVNWQDSQPGQYQHLVCQLALRLTLCTPDRGCVCAPTHVLEMTANHPCVLPAGVTNPISAAHLLAVKSHEPLLCGLVPPT